MSDKNSPKNIEELSLTIIETSQEKILPSIIKIEEYVALINKRIDNPYLYHPRVQEIKALIQQNKYNIVCYDAQTNFGNTSERVKVQEKKKISEGVIELLQSELKELRIYCTHKKLDGVSAINVYSNNCDICGFKK